MFNEKLFKQNQFLFRVYVVIKLNIYFKDIRKKWDIFYHWYFKLGQKDCVYFIGYVLIDIRLNLYDFVFSIGFVFVGTFQQYKRQTTTNFMRSTNGRKISGLGQPKSDKKKKRNHHKA